MTFVLNSKENVTQKDRKVIKYLIRKLVKSIPISRKGLLHDLISCFCKITGQMKAKKTTISVKTNLNVSTDENIKTMICDGFGKF